MVAGLLLLLHPLPGLKTYPSGPVSSPFLPLPSHACPSSPPHVDIAAWGFSRGYWHAVVATFGSGLAVQSGELHFVTARKHPKLPELLFRQHGGSIRLDSVFCFLLLRSTSSSKKHGSQ